ncbi:MAG TPA: TonB-dependent receptor [Vicinamibacterales bacterium]|nr:TonB-dependent receptor [Vicinamibacterales bacterium]
MTSRQFVALLAVVGMLPPIDLRAQGSSDLASTSIEDLLNIEVVSASHIQQRRSDVPAAVFVITADDIRRSGATLVPELLRGVPGMFVARINATGWAISARGFNDLWANKLLVLIDGRSVYSRTFSGVDWSSLDLPLGDIERIEVIRGPGGSVWGANAVNGVINIITKSAADTQGAVVGVESGTADLDRVGVRYGSASGRTAYRISSQWSDGGSPGTASGNPIDESWQRWSAGLRLDWANGADKIVTEASVVAERDWPLWASFAGPAPSLSLAPPTSADSLVTPTAMFGWTHALASGASFETKFFTDLRRRRIGNGTSQDEGFGEAEAQFNTKIGGRHAIAVGGGFRRSQVNVGGSIGYSLTPSDVDFDTASGFAQDDITLGRDVRVSLGSRFEHDDKAGNALDPSVRAMWDIAPHHRAWAAVSHADRTPSATDLFVRYNFATAPGPGGLPVLVGYRGNSDFHDEEVTNIEAGYRLERRTASIDINAYRAAFTNLSTTEPMAPSLEPTPAPLHLFAGYELRNLQTATATGVEFAAHWVPVANWRVDASYTGFRFTPRVDPASRDAIAASFDGNAPARQWQVRSSGSIGPIDVDGSVYGASRLEQMQVPGYTRVDARVAVAVSPRLTIAATGRNLLDSSHQEFAENPYVVASTDVRRSIGVHLEWRIK